MLACAALPAWAQQQAPAAAPAASELSRVVISTGSRGKQIAVTNSPSPIDVVSGEEIRASGKASLREVIGTLVPSYTAPSQPGGGTSASVRPTKIRGLSGDMLLVLVNGKRRHNTAVYNNFGTGSVPVDLDLIPVSAIERIEVLRDGAAAQYGSDAIAGVLNIILKRSADGGSIALTAGQQQDRPGDLAQVGFNKGLSLGEDGGFINVSVDVRLQGPSYSAGEAQGPFYFPLLNGKPVPYGTPGATPDPREETIDRLFAKGSGRSNRDSVINTAYNAELPFSEAVTLYSFSTFSYRDIVDTRGSYRPNSLNTLLEVFPDGFATQRLISQPNYQLAFGSKGLLAGWNYDLSATYARDLAVLNARNTTNSSLGPTNAKTEFYLGNLLFKQSTVNFDITREIDIGTAKPAQLSFGLEDRWERYAEGAGEPDSYRDGGYIYPVGTPRAGQRPPAGLQSFIGTSARDAGALERNSVAAYADLGANITQNFYASAAARFERYNDSSGDTASGKLSLRYEVAEGFAVRGTASTGFRAPSLAQQIFSVTQSSSVRGNDGVVRSALIAYLPPTSPAAKSLGASPLTPEKSKNLSLGLTFEPARGLRLTVDAYQIKVSDLIIKGEALTDSGGSTIVRDALLSIGLIDPAPTSSAQYNLNAADITTRGIDITSEYSTSHGTLGQVRWSALYNRNKISIDRIKANPAELAAFGTRYTPFGRVAQSQLTGSSPKDKLVLGANWSRGPATANLRLTRFGGYTEAAGATAALGLDRTFAARWITDLELGWKLTRSITAALGANNLFGVRPTSQPVTPTADAALPGGTRIDATNNYGSFSPYGVNGRFAYARLSYEL
ncbi:TonB-dependent receptor plug domain-containing protein [Roseateles sp.]|uniref:TonB-dependent receptor plug domain-containing protein n=1 Tax=Roseateles sp. TaxID=1971397 RepID=UPI0039EB8E5A